MKTLADFKRRLTPGTPVTVTWHQDMMVHGNLGETVLHAPPTQRRTVKSVHGGYVRFLRPDGRTSRLDWPKAALFRVVDADTVDIYDELDPTRKLLTYHFNTQ